MSSQVRRDIRQIWRPIHPTARIFVLQPDIVHIVTRLRSRGTFRRLSQNLLEYLLTLRNVDVVVSCGHSCEADLLLGLKTGGDIRTVRDEAGFVRVRDVGGVLCDRVDPAVANEKACDVPFSAGGGGVAV